MTERAILLKREGDYITVSVEAGGQWVEVIREGRDGPISHIAESSGVKTAIKNAAIKSSEKDLRDSGGIVNAP